MNPEVFKIIDGKLYLSFKSDAADQFEADASANIEKADASWKTLAPQQ